MKKLIVVAFLLFVSLNLFAQKSELKFDKKIYDCENEWATLPKNGPEGDYFLGLIYFDPFKGYVFNIMNSFKIDVATNKYIPVEKQITSNIIHVVDNPKINFYIIPKERYRELNIDKIGDSYAHRYDEKNASDLLKKGYHLNHFGASDKAVGVLETAYKIDKKMKGLIFELSYAYNATNQFEKAIKLLHEAIKREPNMSIYYKELGYSHLLEKKLDLAETVYKKGIEISTNKDEKAEMAYNLTFNYFDIKNKDKFNEWFLITQKFADSNSQYSKNVELMKAELNK